MDKVIIIFGFSGSGKSTLANLIGKKYGLRVVHPSGILRNLCEGKPVDIKNTRHNTGFWETEEGIRLFKSRLEEKEPSDAVSDRLLLKEVSKGDVVIDSWSLPWLASNGIKIYLEADLDVRAERVAKRDSISYSRAKHIVSMKDEETQKLFKRMYGFDIKKDYTVFVYVINTNRLGKREVFRLLCDYLGKC
ncbi:MAG TPA: AAA family ATPase [Nanoarchaeota archaeon]|nr:AAA family ATPase [Nanoarchaeota archaeon]